ncbi:isoprenoid biosynthesis glyoxalase ElbB [Desulfoluna spongiiphila]|uniref:Enhancing lycopene biosynthesis protein 2 n=1 Tax=Desulfoluna spongiiphila TaxID=419481 RepID=A0A1G5JHE1_9BACT|nr:isoprenoid biosynthesis glyoxalase ElbB [Desulfoluna spongiiphila]SCY87310.1 Enhancing lycopene biosynthesis protein 2 [Desulfoluna spongiiphila]VVS94845.1 glyoxalase elbb [Desulfoluna spongiiphila]
MKKIGVLLSGCGNMDGSEIHESVLSLLFIDKAGAKAVCMAPDMTQTETVNHPKGETTRETRQVLAEAGRIARGHIRPITDVNVENLDALIIPGGAGPVKNLSTYAEKGPDFEVRHDVTMLIRAFYTAGKPIGAICIAPVILAKALSAHDPKVTIGDDAATIDNLKSFGAAHQAQPVDGICIDEANMLVTTPAYMRGPGIADIAIGIEKLVTQVISMTKG